MRIRARYTKLEKIRFISAIDMGRIWERGLRRARLPIAYSEGFSPHPKVSFPDALTLGYASTGEYAELTFVGDFALPPAIAALNDALPAGLDVIHAVTVTDGAPRLSTLLRASVWDLSYGGTHDDLPVTDFHDATADIMDATTVTVPRQRKAEVTEVDLRPAVLHLHAHATGVRVVLATTEPPMRPAEVHAALAQRLPALTTPPALVTRIAQGRPTHEGVTEALSGTTVHAAPEHQKADTNE